MNHLRNSQCVGRVGVWLLP